MNLAYAFPLVSFLAVSVGVAAGYAALSAFTVRFPTDKP